MAVGTDTPAPVVRKRRARPAFVLVMGAVAVLRLSREFIGREAWSRFGWIGVVVIAAVGLTVVLVWRALQRRRIRRRGGEEFTPEAVRQQLADAGMAEPAFVEDGTLLGSSILVVNQRSKVLEINTTYEVFGSAGQRLGAIHQIGQSTTRKLFRAITAFDQFFTHHFEIEDGAGAVVLRLTRPRKLFKSTLRVFGADDEFIGSIRQRNIFWKIRFELQDAAGRRVGELRATNVRAWDFRVVDATDAEIAAIFKSWEGWAQTAFTRADRYVIKIERPLEGPIRQLTMAAALTVDLALKQDARGIG